MKIFIKTIFILLLSYKINAMTLISPEGLSHENYQKQILESYSIESFIDYYTESPLDLISQKKLRQSYKKAHDLYITGNFNQAVRSLRKVMSYRHSQDWTDVYRKMIADTAKKLSIIDSTNSTKWKSIYNQFTNKHETKTYDLSHLSNEAQFIINGVLQNGSLVEVDTNLKFRISIISNKYFPFSVVTNLEGLKSVEYIKKPFLSKSCSPQENSYIKSENIKVAYHKSCKQYEQNKFIELFSNNSSESSFKKPLAIKKKKNRWLLLGAGLLVGAIAYSKNNDNEKHSRGF